MRGAGAIPDADGLAGPGAEPAASDRIAQTAALHTSRRFVATNQHAARIRREKKATIAASAASQEYSSMNSVTISPGRRNFTGLDLETTAAATAPYRIAAKIASITH